MRRAALALAFLAACAPSRGAPIATNVRPHDTPAPATPRVRSFLGTPEDAFWVSRAPDLDRVVCWGARIELRPGGAIVRMARGADRVPAQDALIGGLAVPAWLGGGFVFWSRDRLFRARDFTGDLEPLATGLGSGIQVRGARAGLRSIVVLTDAGPRELRPGSDGLVAASRPGLVDVVALSPEVAVELDSFGGVRVTKDGGASFSDPSVTTGIVRQLVAGPNDVWIEGWRARYRVGSAGAVEPASYPDAHRGYDTPNAFQTAWSDLRPTASDNWPWSLRAVSPLAVVLGGGAPVGDGTAFGVAQSTVVRVDLASGRLLAIAPDWLPPNLSCQPVRAPDAVLFACVVERSQGYGGYVLRSVDGAPPELEKAFSDDGSFVAGDDGSLGFVGSCRAEARLVDPNDSSRFEGDPSFGPVLCTRVGPGRWVEVRVDPGGATLVGWAPRVDGHAAALALSNDPLPPPVGAPRAVEQGGATLVRVFPEIPGWTWSAPGIPGRAGVSGWVDRRFALHDDGTIDGWLAPANDTAAPLAIGVTLDAAGSPAAHEPPPGMTEIATAGAFALAYGKDQLLYETLDHGRTWRARGAAPSPLPPTNFACSSMGCMAGPLARVGWGVSDVDPRLAPEPSRQPAGPPRRASAPLLSCVPRGEPSPIASHVAMPGRFTLSTGWGESLDGWPDPAPRELTPTLRAPRSPKVPARAGRPPRSAPPAARTHTLRMRAPFEPFAAPRELHATDVAVVEARHARVVPLLARSGDVDLLVGADEGEVLLAGDRMTLLPAFEPRRHRFGPDPSFAGLALPGDRALVLADLAPRGLTLEDHGPGPTRPSLFLGGERVARGRRFALARRGDGAVGVLVADDGAAGATGVGVFDPVSAHLGAIAALAPWRGVLAGDDPRCRSMPDAQAWRAILVVDPKTWLALDDRALPGIALGSDGALLVRWSADRVCLDGLDAVARDVGGRRGEDHAFHLVALWAGGKDRGATLRADDLRQELACRIVAMTSPPP